MPIGSLPKPTSIAALFRIVGQERAKKTEGESLSHVGDIAYHALYTLPLLGRDALQGEEVGSYYADKLAAQPGEDMAKRPTGQLDIMAAWYKLIPTSDEGLLRNIDFFFNTSLESVRRTKSNYENPRVVQLAQGLGQAGEELLKTRSERREAERQKISVYVSYKHNS